MRRVEGTEFEIIRPFFQAAADRAKLGKCLLDKCGAVIVSPGGLIIGSGYNAPPADDESVRMCGKTATLPHTRKPKSDITCCTHAEVRAVMDATEHHPDKLPNSTLYFMRVDFETEAFTDAGDPYCTLCSRTVMDAGVGEFALYSVGGANIYPLGEYNLRSYAFHET